MFVNKTTVEKEMLEHIQHTTTLKDAWETLAARFSNKNDMRLQLLENKLMSTTQRELTINQYFTKVKFLCCEIFELVYSKKINE